jgi:hypothetical protein
MTQGRSSIPKVVGILMIVFSSLGLLFTLLALASAGGGKDYQGMQDLPAFKTLNTMQLVFNALGVGIGILHLVAGISAVRYKASAPKLAMSYAVLNIVTTIAYLVMVFAWLKPALEKAGFPEAGSVVGGVLLVSGVLSVTWPVIVLVLMSRPSARAACTG